MPDWRAIASRPVNERILALEALGPRIAKTVANLLDHPWFVERADSILERLNKVAVPERALDALEGSIAGDPAVPSESTVSIIFDLAGASSRAARMLQRDPDLAIQLEGPPPDDAEIKSAIGTEDFDRSLRRFRNRELLRIALSELRGGDVRQTSAQIAELADALMRAAVQHHLPLLVAESGPPDPPCAHAVIAMGKLGGLELNFASDIDVIYFYEHDDGHAGPLSMHQFHVKLFERAQKSLSKVTEEGFVFRVDADLRPEGKRGPLANSLASAERYYQTWGRTWERAAWIRARPIAGDPKFGDQIIEMMRPFVYRRSFDMSAIEEILAMKAKIDVERKKKTLSPFSKGIDLKLDGGGIREIEFFVQAHQLLHGGKNDRLRSQNTIVALKRLESEGIISARTAQEMGDTYMWLRKIEHRIQIVEDQQSHRFPSEGETRDAIARSLAYATGEELERALKRRMKKPHAVFLSMHGAAKDEEPIPAEILLLADLDADESDRSRVLEEFGVRNTQAALANLDAAARHPKSPFHPRAQPDVARMFLLECCRSPDVDRALKHLPGLARAFIVQPGLFEELKRPLLRRGVARVLGASDLLARIIESNPRLLHDVLLVSQASTIREIELKDDIEASLDDLRMVKQEETLRTAVADMAQQITTEMVGRRLSHVADLLIGAALELATRETVERYGECAAEIGVVAGGALGAFEMGYRTDLDLSIIYKGEGDSTGGSRGSINCAEFSTRVVQRLLRNLTIKTSQGDLWPVDMRLRPSGSQGALVTSLDQFTRYHGRGAQLWERQALVRSRTVAGSPTLRREIDRSIEVAAYESHAVDDDAREKIHAMRVRMAKERGKSQFDLKFSSGGLVEVQFLVQHLLLKHGPEKPELRTTSTRDALRRLGALGLLEEAPELERAYDVLRKTQNWLRIIHDEMIDNIALGSPFTRSLALTVGYQGDDAAQYLERDLLSAAKTIHHSYVEVLHEDDSDR